MKEKVEKYKNDYENFDRNRTVFARTVSADLMLVM